jgi:hypothetical protein
MNWRDGLCVVHFLGQIVAAVGTTVELNLNRHCHKRLYNGF